MKSSLSKVGGLIIILLLFIGADTLADTHTQEIVTMIESYGMGGKMFFTAIAMLAVVIPIWSNIFLIPFGVITWGPFLTAIFCITGWFFGSIVSFYIARIYKEWLLTKYPSLHKYDLIDSLIPDKHMFLSLIFLRMTMPVDILSYALGLFSKRIHWKQNAITTLIGISPFAFIFSYIGIFETKFQVALFSSTFLLFILYVIIRKRNIREQKESVTVG